MSCEAPGRSRPNSRIDQHVVVAVHRRAGLLAGRVDRRPVVPPDLRTPALARSRRRPSPARPSSRAPPSPPRTRGSTPGVFTISPSSYSSGYSPEQPHVAAVVLGEEHHPPARPARRRCSRDPDRPPWSRRRSLDHVGDGEHDLASRASRPRRTRVPPKSTSCPAPAGTRDCRRRPSPKVVGSKSFAHCSRPRAGGSTVGSEAPVQSARPWSRRTRPRRAPA